MSLPTRWDQVADEEDARKVELDLEIRTDVDDNDYRGFLEEVADPLAGKASLNLDLSNIRVNSHELDLSREQFVPAKFLALLHKETPIGKLHEGHEHLAQRVESRQQQLNVLVQNNFHRFVRCKDTIDDIFEMLDSGGKCLVDIQILTDTLKEIQMQARDTFGRMITRQEEIDSIRSVLSILTRVKFRFIFQLPEVMEQDMMKKDYSKVVFQYKKVKGWLQDTNVAMFKQVLNQAEKTIQRLKMILFASLENPQTKLEVQEKTIRLLLSLGGSSGDSPLGGSSSDTPSPSNSYGSLNFNPLMTLPPSPGKAHVKDPAWHCLATRHRRICELLRDSDNSVVLIGANESRSLQSVRRLSNVMHDLIPDFWKLTKSFFNGEYHKGLSLPERTDIEMKLPQLEVQFGVLMQEIMDLFIKGILKHFFGKDFTLEETGGDINKMSTPRVATLQKTLARRRRNRPSILPPTEKEPTAKKPKKNLKGSNDKVKLYRTDSSPRKRRHNAIPSDDIKGITDLKGSNESDLGLSGELRMSSDQNTKVTFTSMAMSEISNESDDDEDHEKLVAEDREKVEAIVKCVKTLDSNRIPFFYLEGVHKALDQIIVSFVTHTFDWALAELRILYTVENFEIVDNTSMTTIFPTTFASIVKSALDEFRGIIGENDEVILKEVDAKFVECLNCYADNIHHLAFLFTQREQNNDFMETVNYESQLLVLMNNCRFAHRQLIPDLIRQYCVQFQRPDPDRPNFMTMGFLKQLEEMLLRRYLKLKTLNVNSFVQRGLLLSGFDWNRSTYYDGINDYVMEVLLQIVSIHEELCRLSASRIRKILATIVSNVFGAYEHYLSMVDRISTMGKLQLAKELQFIRSVTEQFIQDEGADLIYETIQVSYGLDKLLDVKHGEITSQLRKIVQSDMERALQDSLVLFECFYPEEDEDGTELTDATLEGVA